MVLTGLALLAVILLLLLLYLVREIVAVLFLGVVLGVSLNPLVERLERWRVPRVLSVLLVYAVVALAFAVFAYYAAREIGNQALELEFDEIKASYEDFRRDANLPAASEVEAAIREAGGGLTGGLVSRAISFVTGVFYFCTVLFSALLFTVTQDRMRDAALSFVAPDRRAEVEAVLHKLARGLRGFMAGEFLAMVSIGAVTYLGLLIIGVKLPLVLAFIAFTFEALPMIGPWLAFIPALGVALTDGIWAVVQVSILYLLIQGFENYIVTPLVHGRESRVPALLILVAILVGGGLMGVLGALVALPLAVMGHILFFEVVVPWNERRFARESEVEVVRD